MNEQYERALKLIKLGIPISEIRKLGVFSKYNEIKDVVRNDELEKLDEIDMKIKNKFKKLEEEYKNHI